jgi:hypothetical protein
MCGREIQGMRGVCKEANNTSGLVLALANLPVLWKITKKLRSAQSGRV